MSSSTIKEQGRKAIAPDFPKVELHHYTENILDIGATSMTKEGFTFLIYDVERCVCDAVKFRNKVGMDVCSKIIDNYLNRQDRNITKLMDYAQLLRVANILEKIPSSKTMSKDTIKNFGKSAYIL